MNRFSCIIAVLVSVMLVFACNPKTEVPEASSVLVKVYNSELLTTVLNDMMPENIRPEDSAYVADELIRHWVNKQLLYQYAKKELVDSSDINNRVEDFRRELYKYEIQEQYLRANLDSVVNDDEISEYHKEHLGEYKLKEMAVKAHYMQMDVNVATFYHELDKVRRSSSDNMDELYRAIKRTNKKIVEHKDWIYLSTLLEEIHSELIPQVSQGLQVGYFYTEDGEHRYIVKINDKLMPGDTVPVELVSQEIKEIIIIERKQDLMADLTNQLRQDAKTKQKLVYNEK